MQGGDVQGVVDGKLCGQARTLFFVQLNPMQLSTLSPAIPLLVTQNSEGRPLKAKG